MSLTANPNPVPHNQTDTFVQGNSGDGSSYTRIERQVNGGGYVSVANNTGSNGELGYTSTFANMGDVHDFRFYAGASEGAATLRDTLTGVRRGTNHALTNGAGGVAYFNRSDGGASRAFQTIYGIYARRGKFDAEGRSDLVVVDSSYNWYFYGSNSDFAHYQTIQWGQSGDIPVVGDWDADGTDDIGVFRPSTGQWRLLKSSNSYSQTAGQFLTISHGQSGDVPFVGRFLVTTRDDICVWRSSTAAFYFYNVSTNATSSALYGLGTDVPVLGDWNNDGIDTVGVFRNGSWFLRNSNTTGNADISLSFGTTGDIPYVGDFDGDGTDDVAVWRTSNATFYVRKSSDTNTISSTYISNAVTPIIADFDNDGKHDFAYWTPAIATKAAVSGDIRRTRQLAAQSDGVASVSVTSTYPRVAKSLGGTVNGVTDVSVTSTYPRVAKSLGGTIAGVASVTPANGSPAVAKPLSGSIAGVASVTPANGSPAVAKPLSGSIAGVADVSASRLIAALALAGQSSGSSSVEAIRLSGIFFITGQSDGAASVSATGMTALLPLAGTSDGVSSVTGNLGLLHLLSGSSAGAASISAALHRLVGLNGLSSGISVVSADLTRLIYLTGQSDGVATLTSNLELLVGLSGIVNGVAVVSGELELEALVLVPTNLNRWNWGMLEQVNNTIRFYAFFSSARVGRAGLTPTVDVWNPAGTKIVSDAAATELGGGLYFYSLTGGSVGNEGEYIAMFKSIASGLDMNHVPSLWSVGRAGIENLNAPIGSVPNVSAIQGGVWTALLANFSAAGNAAEKLLAAGAGGDPLTNQVPGSYAVNSAGWALGRMLTQAIINTYIGSPVVGNKLTIVRGDAYMNTDGRALIWTDHNNIWPTLTGATIAFTARLSNPRVQTAPTTRSGSVLVATGNSKQVMVELPSGTTSPLLPGTENYDYDVQATLQSGNPATLARGPMTVIDDITV